MAHPDDNQIVSGHLDEGTVHAWLDGQLSADEAMRVESHVAACATCAAQVAEARGFVAASSRILQALDGVPARVVPARRHRVQLWHVRAAAAVLIVALGTATVLHDAGVPGFSRYRAAKLAASDHVTATSATGLQEGKVAAAGAPPPTAAPLSKELATREEAAAPVEKKGPRLGARDESKGSGVRGQEFEAAADAKVPRRAENKEQTAVSGIPGASPPMPAGAPAGLAGGVAAQGVAPAAPAIAGRLAAPVPGAPSVQLQREVAGASERNAVAASDSGTAPRPSRAAAMAVPLAAERDITGRVVDADSKMPIAAASVAVLGYPARATTDDSGFFQLRAPAGGVTLTTKRIGFEAARVDVATNQRDTTIALAKSPAAVYSIIVSGASGACVGQVVSVSASNSGDSYGPAREVVRLGSLPSTDSLFPGFALAAPSNTGVAPTGAWNPLGRDSAIVSIPSDGGRAAAQMEKRAADSVAIAAPHDQQIVRTRVRCSPR
jgi:hypothetical protein